MKKIKKKITSTTKRWSDWDLNDVYDKGYKRGVEAERKRILEIVNNRDICLDEDYDRECNGCKFINELKRQLQKEMK